jgi:hypothetical protein
MATNQTTTTRGTSRPLPVIEVTPTEVIAEIASESNPNRKPYQTILNRYSARPSCDCPGFRSHRHCKHCDALVALSLDENLIIKVRRGKPAEAKAVLEDYDPYSDPSLGLDLADLTPAEAEYADRLASEAEVAAYQTECQARYFAGGCC